MRFFWTMARCPGSGLVIPGNGTGKPARRTRKPLSGGSKGTIVFMDVLLEAILFGILLGCFYAAVSIGLSVSFGLLDVPHVAHPASW